MGIKVYNEDILLLVIPAMTYSEKVLVVVESKIIDQVMGMIMKGELMRATVTWKQDHFGAVMSGLPQLPHTDSKGNGEVGMEVTSSPGSDTTTSREFCLDDVQGPVNITWRHTWQCRCLGTLHAGPHAC